MGRETVRNLKRMPWLLLIIRNLCLKGRAPQEILENIRELDNLLKAVLSGFPETRKGSSGASGDAAAHT
jgi:hypothetical protein